MKLFLIDGHALIFKMYYAFLGRPMVNSKGEDTSIIYGFTKYLLDLIQREHPTHLAVSFDPPGGTFRNRLFPEYKANRPETPSLIVSALEPLTEIVRSLGIPVLMVNDYEADDVIGTVASRFSSDHMDVYMVTPDKDYGQLVSKHVYQYKPGKAGGENEILDEAAVCAKYGIASTAQVIDMLALCGDSADNVPGVSGVGPVGAAKLLSKYSSVEGIYQHIDELTAKQQAMFREAEPHMALSKTLVTIDTAVPVEISEAELALPTKVDSKIVSLIGRHEMKSLLKMVNAIWTVEDAESDLGLFPSEKVSVSLDFEQVSVEEITRSIRKSGQMAVLISGRSAVVGSGSLVCGGPAQSFESLLEDENIEKIGYDLKSVMKSLYAEGIELKGHLQDAMLLHYVINPERNHHLDAIVKEFLGVDLEENADQPQMLSLFDEVDAQESSTTDYRTVTALGLTVPELKKKLSGENDVYEKIEEPLIRVLFEMERDGVFIDVAVLRSFADSLRLRMTECEKRIRDVAGDPSLNVASPKQLGELLYEKLKLDPKVRKSPRGSYPTDEETLSALSDKSPIIEDILEYRGARKLLSTYIEPIPGYVSQVDGRVHTTFNQALTSTGRLSSSNPNLQNIPVRTEDGQQIRRAFVAPDGYVIMSADYSQIELRVMAHCCADEHMISAFRDGLDVHSAMAAKIFHKPLEEVTSQDRRMAKTANFGIMYGISSFGLAQRLNVSRTQASALIEDYFASFPSIRIFLDKILQDARANGYVQTLFGRRRYVPDVNSTNGNVRAVAERNAINAPIQGTAADIIKLAMTGVSQELHKRGLKSRMILQIHDELMLEVPESEIDEVKRLLTEQMENVVKLSVPLTVECNYGKNWLEAH